MAVGTVALVASVAWFVVELVHLLMEPPGHDHLPLVLVGLLTSIALGGGSISLVLHGRTAYRRARRSGVR